MRVLRAAVACDAHDAEHSAGVAASVIGLALGFLISRQRADGVRRVLIDLKFPKQQRQQLSMSCSAGDARLEKARTGAQMRAQREYSHAYERLCCYKKFGDDRVMSVPCGIRTGMLCVHSSRNEYGIITGSTVVGQVSVGASHGRFF